MSTRFLPVALLLSALFVAACDGAAATLPAPSGAPSVPAPTSAPTDGNLGDVDGIQDGRPELVVETAGFDKVRVSVIDPTAKAWRIVVASRDGRDRLELIVESGDVVHGIRIDEIIDGAVNGSDDLTHMPGDETVAAGGCHRTLEVCWASFDVYPPGPDGVLVADLGFANPNVDVSITGGSANWPGEPFILGPWRDTLQFQTWAA